MYDVPGLIHANFELSRHNLTGDWPQAQCDSPIRPEYIPAKFIAEIETDNERQNYPYFRDYQFAEIENCADFVFDRISAARDTWCIRQQ